MAILKAESYPLPENGLYPAVIERIEEKKTSFGEALNFMFTTLAAVGNTRQGTKLFGLVSPVVTPRSKMSRWLAAVGIKLEVGGDALDPQTLVGKKVIVSVVVTPDGKFANVAELHPFNEALYAETPTPVAPAPVAPVPMKPPVAPVAKATPIATPVPVPTLENLNDAEDQLF